MDKRSFLKGLTLAGLSVPLSAKSLESLMRYASGKNAGELAIDEAFWDGIKGKYRLKPDYINLESGYYNILPQEVLEKYIEHIREVNFQGAYYMRTVQFDNIKLMANKVARIAGCSTDEIILTRNTTESLDMIIGGLNWQAGDEAIMAEQDYGAMLDMFKQVSRKYGTINKIVSVPNHPNSDDEIVQFYANAITPKTKLLMVSHMINITGHILPVQKICDMAHAKGVEVLVDGAHAFAHFQYNIPDLHCDYYGASLHKWLSVPLGVGMLYVKKENIKKIWPLLADGNPDLNDIGRLNHLGTHPVHTDLAVADAVEFYEKLGPEKKETRLKYLQQYWTSKVRNQGNVIVNTPIDPKRSCAIANVGIKGMAPGLLAERLLKEYKIYTVAIDVANVHGCRITPNVFTSPKELDILVKALLELG
ncbi:MAG: aminotransferase class V-fold PLP-dependent enzyme [Bacteroidetes bacterium]|nr:aminotransferase class V-fold PLP-dependent enzyme [Bacteroidota bacterium]